MPTYTVNPDRTQPYIKENHLTGRGLYAENTARNYLNKLSDLQILRKRKFVAGIII